MAWKTSRQQRGDRDRPAFEERVADVELPYDGEHGDACRVDPEQHEDAEVPATPDGFGQVAALGHETVKTHSDPSEGGGREAKVHRLGYRRIRSQSGDTVSTRRFGQHGQDFLSKVSAKLPVTDPDSVNGSDYTRGGNA